MGMHMSRNALLVLTCGLLSGLLACESSISNPRTALSNRDLSNSTHTRSIEMLAVEPELDEADLVLLEGIVWRPGYGQVARRAALDLLWRTDSARTIVLLRRQLPRMIDWPWLTEVCQWIADRDIEALDPALISSWGRPRSILTMEEDRPEYLALVQMHGRAVIVDLIFDLFLESNKPSQGGLRQRCWDLLHRLDERGRLIELASQAEPDEADLLLVDLHASASTFGMVPYNREEIIWLQKLRQPERDWFWTEAEESIKQLPEARRTELQMRDLAVVVAAARHRPDLLTATDAELMARTEAALRDQRHYSESAPGIGTTSRGRERFRTHRDKMLWGDVAAIQLAQEALRYPQIRSHLFDYADRDNADESTEYGGIIALDERGRFEVLEFMPRIRSHDRRFNAPQTMFDEGYTSLFHFHFHAQRKRNADHAGPGLGDMNYADNTRANCLVLTFVDADRMNVDFYRHGRVIVDLGTISRPAS
jgi:hypothetical protein